MDKKDILESLKQREEIAWVNPLFTTENKNINIDISKEEMKEAAERLKRFAPFIETCFPETKERNGLIESPLTSIPSMKEHVNNKYQAGIEGDLYLKEDNQLAVAGSVKARGGIYEVLKHTEELALANRLITKESNYTELASPKNKEFFKDYKIQVGSTGNLGLSIGIASAAIGFTVIIHMSADAREWKKDLLQEHGVTVIEYESDYSEAVKKGRALSDADSKSYFVDDENSKDLFYGYAVAAIRLEKQLKEKEIQVDSEHPLFVYIPCGVGGAPGGVTFGLKEIFGEDVHVFFIEPTETPCMLLGMSTGKHDKISVNDIGLSGKTHADGLAVGRASGFIGKVMEPILSGIFTIKDYKLYDYMRDLLETEEIFLEPSGAAAFEGVIHLQNNEETKKYIKANIEQETMKNATHIAWGTGGNLVPKEVRDEYKETRLDT